MTTRLPSLVKELVLSALLVLGFVIVRVSGGDAAATIQGSGSLEALVGATVPAATGGIAPTDAGARGLELVLTPGRDDVRREASNPFAYGDLSWRASMLAASLASDQPEIGAYRLAAPDDMKVAVPPAAVGLLEGSLPAPAESAKLDRLGSISEAEARAQMESNLQTLHKLNPDIDLSSSVAIVPVDPASNRYGLTVVLRTESAASLIKDAGDVLVGLQTGLVGGVDATVEGLSITVEEGGRPMLAAWSAARAMAGTTMAAPGVELPDALEVSGDYPNLTGGPAVTSSVSGAVAEAPSVPTDPRVTLRAGSTTMYSAPGFVTTPNSGDVLGPPYSPHLRPRLRVRAGEKVVVGLTAPGNHLTAIFRRPNAVGDAPVRLAYLGGRRLSEDGMRWAIRVPSWAKIGEATTVRLCVRYGGGSGRYEAGLLPLR